jgi:murein L,D-transpeptidase YcbB/YkuD
MTRRRGTCSSRDQRALSHGCVRLQQPQAMAAAVLGKTESTM